MNLAETISPKIWENPKFQEQYRQLATANFLRKFKEPGKPALLLDDSSIRQLLESALIFASTNEHTYREAAKQISTSAYQLLSSGSTMVSELFSLIQSRLRNFPMLLSTSGDYDTPKNLPLALQVEFNTLKRQQSVDINSVAHILTPFQLETWRTLASGSNVTLSAPPSAGKSYVILLHLLDKIDAVQKLHVAYIVPTRALITQVAEDIRVTLGSEKYQDVSITTIPADVTDRHQRAVFVLTQERLEALLVQHQASPSTS